MLFSLSITALLTSQKHLDLSHLDLSRLGLRDVLYVYANTQLDEGDNDALRAAAFHFPNCRSTCAAIYEIDWTIERTLCVSKPARLFNTEEKIVICVST